MNHHKIIQNLKNKDMALYSANLLFVRNFKNYFSIAANLGLKLEVDNLPKEPRFIYCTKPPINFYKLNVDGAIMDSNVGCGGVIRDSHGNFILDFVGHLLNCEVNYATTSLFSMA